MLILIVNIIEFILQKKLDSLDHCDIMDMLIEKREKFMLKDCNRVLEIFGGFVYRAYGFPNSEIRKEFALIAECGNLENYIRADRKGRKLALNRKLRRDLYSLFENANNHACFEREMLENI